MVTCLQSKGFHHGSDSSLSCWGMQYLTPLLFHRMVCRCERHGLVTCRQPGQSVGTERAHPRICRDLQLERPARSFQTDVPRADICRGFIQPWKRSLQSPECKRRRIVWAARLDELGDMPQGEHAGVVKRKGGRNDGEAHRVGSRKT